MSIAVVSKSSRSSRSSASFTALSRFCTVGDLITGVSGVGDERASSSGCEISAPAGTGTGLITTSPAAIEPAFGKPGGGENDAGIGYGVDNLAAGCDGRFAAATI